MSEKNTINETWPLVGSLVCINAGTRLLTADGNIAIVPDIEDEIIGIVLANHPACEYVQDHIDVVIEDRIYQIVRTPSPHIDIDPYFNIRGINDDGTTTKF